MNVMNFKAEAAVRDACFTGNLRPYTSELFCNTGLSGLYNKIV